MHKGCDPSRIREEYLTEHIWEFDFISEGTRPNTLSQSIWIQIFFFISVKKVSVLRTKSENSYTTWGNYV